MNSTRSSGSGRRRVGVAGLWHETNTYSARPTGIEAFEAFELLAGDAVVARHRGTRTVVAGMLAAQPFETVPVWTAGAWPSGRLRAGTLSTLLESLARSLERAGMLDGLLLNLHGAMVAESHLALHSWPEEGRLFLDVASCKDLESTRRSLEAISAALPEGQLELLEERVIEPGAFRG